MKKLIIAMAVFLCVFAVLAVGFTYTGIRLTRETDITGKTDEGNIEVTGAGIDLYGTYDGNDLLIETLVEEYRGVEVGIPRISGLKDREIQEKINSDMYSRVCELLDEYETVEYANFYTRANFANTISICFNVSGGENYEILCLNYELVNGNCLKLEDIFLGNTDILSMVRKGFFEELATMGEYDSESEAMLYNENQLYKTVKNYMNDAERSFAFSPVGVYFYYGNRTGSVDMLGNAEYIGIYSKYMTDESIFEQDGIGFDGAFTCSDTTSYKELFSMIDYGFAESNLWYDITVWKSYVESECPADKSEAFERFQQDTYAAFVQEVEPYRELALQNPDKFYILMMKPGVSMYTERENTGGEYMPIFSEAAGVSRNTRLYEMPLELYESKYKAKLLEAYRYQYFAMAGGAYIDTAEDSRVVLTTTSEDKLYNYITGEQYTTLDSIFTDGTYMDKLQYESRQWLTDSRDYSDEEAEELVKTMEYHIVGSGIRAFLPGETEDYAYVGFSEFDKNSLSFFD